MRGRRGREKMRGRRGRVKMRGRRGRGNLFINYLSQIERGIAGGRGGLSTTSM